MTQPEISGIAPFFIVQNAAKALASNKTPSPNGVAKAKPAGSGRSKRKNKRS